MIGAGVVGTTTAYYLAREGLQVTVVDAAAGPGLETSFANGGLVTPSTAFPWSSPGALKLMLSYMGRDVHGGDKVGHWSAGILRARAE